MKIDTKSKKKPKTRKKAIGSPNNYQKALELAEAGRHEEALVCIQEYLHSSPNNAEALNDTGVILHCMNRSDEAIRHLVKARSLQPDSGEIICNLSETYLAAGKAKEAMELFDDMGKMGILSADVLNRTANVLLNTGNLSDAVEMLNRSLRLSPNQKILKPMIETIRRKMAEPSC
ncbi:MAG: tetratricopeptide repeat protein [Sedimentisphaerales bacterium]